ncbi:FecR family protein [Chitinophaga arvensicola]|uniref:Ferric-dicitrate binding protein FerR, regulates iron transport through sigma-19 n=1 Tax=Chitinophaga arvensicola TaxID=29529 RepID=A0A1I0S838_9BACT|nr:FecR domain-containing protein [Chitinophaga arvensicola]SEW51858.1 ferric-dicitrate binding protein FerR, regulates iron transport through sigma-19 [Chitinophaga arvensicola]
MKDNTLLSLIEKYFLDTATPQETDTLMEWYRHETNPGESLTWPGTEEPGVIRDRMLMNINKRRKRLSLYHVFLSRLKYAAAVLLLLGAGILIKFFLLPRHLPVQQIVWTTRSGQRTIFTLPDSSRVWMSPNTEIRYDDAFAEGNRVVQLSGEAFFEVAPDAKKPFLVRTGLLTTTVLGTSFNVNAYPRDTISKVTLLTGAVLVNDGQHTHTLLPLQQAVYNSSNNSLTSQSYPQAALMLQRRMGEIEYQGSHLKEVAADLEHIFNIRLTISDHIQHLVFYGRIRPDEDVDTFLEKLKVVLKIKIIRRNDDYILTSINS